MAVQKTSKRSAKSKRPHRKMMHGGEISENLKRYLASKDITEENGYDFTTVGEEEAKEMFNINEAEYQQWLTENPTEIRSYPINPDEDEEADEAESIQAAPPVEEPVAAAAQAIAQVEEVAPPVAAAQGEPVGETEELAKINSVLAEIVGELSSNKQLGGYKKLRHAIKGGYPDFTAHTDVVTTGDGANIEQVTYTGSSSWFGMKKGTDNTIFVFKQTVPEYQHIIRYIIAKNALKEPNQKPISNTINIQPINSLLNTEDKTELLALLQKYAGYITNMVKILNAYKPEQPGYSYLMNTYIYLDNQLKGLTGMQTNNIITRTIARGGKRRAHKSSHRGGFLDTTRIYNAQGLLSDAVDPLTAAATAGNEVERIPLPFSSRGSGSINYESDINKDFITDLLPSLGQSGGKKTRKTGKK